MDSRGRDIWLDGLRAVAVLLVLGRHAPLTQSPAPWLAVWQRGGWVGVDLFFVLSGFLVCGLLLREYQQRRDLDVPRFLIRRGLRLYPAFFGLLVGTALFAQVLPFPHRPLRAYLVECCFVQNYCVGVWNHTWSLAVEEHCYLGLPLVLLWLVRRGRGAADPFGRLVPSAVAVMLGVALWRGIHGWLWPFTPRTHLFPTHLRLDSLLAGVLLAYGYHYHRQAFERCLAGRRLLVRVLGAVCLAPAFLFPLGETWLIGTFGLSLFALGSALLIAGGVGTAPRVACWLAPLGRSSYSVYLWHMPVLVWGVPWCEKLLGVEFNAPAALAIYLSLSLAVGALMARVTEMPALWVRERWLPARLPALSRPARAA